VFDSDRRRPADHDGQHERSEALFYYFRLEDQVPETHLLRLIEKHISFAFVREQLKDRYSETGRPSIDPELLLRILLIGYLYGISSERKLVEELLLLGQQARIQSFWRDVFSLSHTRAPPASPAQRVGVYTQELDPKQEGAIAVSRTPLWLVSGWGCRGRRFR